MYFTDSPFERLMMERPGYEDRAVDAAWNKVEKKMKKKQGADKRESALSFSKSEDEE